MIKDMIRIAADHYGITPRLLLENNRRRAYSKAKWAIYVALRNRNRNYSEIGRWMKRDHATIIYGVKQAEYWLERDPDFRDLVQRLTDYRFDPVPEDFVRSLMRKKEREDGCLVMD